MELAQGYVKSSSAAPVAIKTTLHLNSATEFQRVPSKTKENSDFLAAEPDNLSKNSFKRENEENKAQKGNTDSGIASPSYASVFHPENLIEPMIVAQRHTGEDSHQASSSLPPLITPQYSPGVMSQRSSNSREEHTDVSPNLSPPKSLSKQSEGPNDAPLDSATQRSSAMPPKLVTCEADLLNALESCNESSHVISMKGTTSDLMRSSPPKVKLGSRRASRSPLNIERGPLIDSQQSTNSSLAPNYLSAASTPLPIPQVEPRLYSVKRGLGMAAAIDQSPIPVDGWGRKHRNDEAEWSTYYDYNYQTPLPSLYGNTHSSYSASQAHTDSASWSRSDHSVPIPRYMHSNSTGPLYKDTTLWSSTEYEGPLPGFVYSRPTNLAVNSGPSSLGYQPISSEAYSSSHQEYRDTFVYDSNSHLIPMPFVPHHLHPNISQRELFDQNPEVLDENSRTDSHLPGDLHSSSSFRNLDAANTSSHGFEENNPHFSTLFHANSTLGNLPGTRQTDHYGIPWLVFEYPENRARKLYRVQCDIENIDVDEFSEEYKQRNCVYPKALVPPEKYSGHRQEYEMNCNEIGWKLVLHNPQLAGHRGLTQRAVDTYRNTMDVSTQSRRARRMAKQKRHSYRVPGLSTRRAR